MLADKVALVTGSSRGIGRAIAHHLARAGADIVINHRRCTAKSSARALSLERAIQKEGRRAFTVVADIGRKEAVDQMIAQVEERFGRLDILILNAARATFKPLERMLARELHQLVETNFLGNIFCIQAAQTLLHQSRGKIIFISSLGSRFYTPAYPLGSMKAAMEAVVRDCAQSLAPKKISVNGICAGLAKTDSFKVLRQHLDSLELVPEHLFVAPREIAEVALFLCSPASSGISGQMLVVDKGLGNRLADWGQTLS